MIIYEITGNIPFDYFYSLNMNIGLTILGCTLVLKMLKF